MAPSKSLLKKNKTNPKNKTKKTHDHVVLSNDIRKGFFCESEIICPGNVQVMGDVVSYFHICYFYSNILLIVIPVKQVIEPGIAQTINLHPLRSSIPLFQKKRFHGTREYFHRFPQFCSPTRDSATGLQQPLSPYNHNF